MTFLPQLNGSAIISYYYSTILTLVGITGASTQTGINAGLNFFLFFCEAGGAFALKKLRRRKLVLTVWPILFIAMAAIMGSSAAFAYSGNSSRSAGIATVILIYVFSAPNQFSGGLFYSYPAEILNFATRAKGMAGWSMTNQACGVFSSFVNSIGLNSIGWKYYAVYLGILPLQWILAYFFMVETHGYSLEEIAIAFEGKGAVVARVDEQIAEIREVGHVLVSTSDSTSEDLEKKEGANVVITTV
jgi:hypothetical protein